MRRQDDLTRLVDSYGTMRAYDEVSRTCDLRGFAAMCAMRHDEFAAQLRIYAKRYRDGNAARAMDDVLTRYNQLTIWED